MLKIIPREALERGEAVWSGAENFDPPEVGSKVLITLNGWNHSNIGWDPGDIVGVVEGYEIVDTVLFACVSPSYFPKWYLRENPNRPISRFVGCELEGIR